MVLQVNTHMHQRHETEGEQLQRPVWSGALPCIDTFRPPRKSLTARSARLPVRKQRTCCFDANQGHHREPDIANSDTRTLEKKMRKPEGKHTKRPHRTVFCVLCRWFCFPVRPFCSCLPFCACCCGFPGLSFPRAATQGPCIETGTPYSRVPDRFVVLSEPLLGTAVSITYSLWPLRLFLSLGRLRFLAGAQIPYYFSPWPGCGCHSLTETISNAIDGI